MRTLTFVALIAAMALAAGCATVKPWERGRLAQPTMQFAVDPYAGEQESTIEEITEGASYSGQPGNAGAGCGCH
jgi:Domain of unknown function (DUF4266)